MSNLNFKKKKIIYQFQINPAVFDKERLKKKTFKLFFVFVIGYKKRIILYIPELRIIPFFLVNHYNHYYQSFKILSMVSFFLCLSLLKVENIN